MSDSRTKNTTRNIFSGLIYRGVTILLPFINRTVILTVLGAEYTGLSSLFTSILGVLNLAELGFNTAVVYCMYKPMAEQNWNQICYYLTLIRKVYNIVGTVVFGSGLCIMPFLRYLISGNYPQEIDLYALYFLYLVNSTISYYLFAYKETLLLADQRSDITNNIRTVVDTLRYLIQFTFLLITKNFYSYVMIQIVGTIFSNFLIQKSTKARYPNIVCQKNLKLKVPEEMKKRTKALMIDRLCNTFRNSFDSIVISSFFGLVETTVYGNYYYIYSAVYGVLSVIGNSLAGSVGNSISCESAEKNYHDLRKFQFLFSGLNIICTTCMVAMYQPFMQIWVGRRLMLSDRDMLLFSLYFYLINMNNIRNQYIDGTGMWNALKWSYILEAFGNLFLNIILGKLFGVTGILCATIFTIAIFNYSVRTHKLFKTYFMGKDEIRYNLDQVQYALIALTSSAIVYVICTCLPFDGIVQLVVCGLIAVVVAGTLFWVAFLKTKRFTEAKQMIVQIILTMVTKK